MGWEALLTGAVVVVMIAVLVRDAVPASVAVFGATVALLLAGVIPAEQALAGFSNPAPITVAALYVLARAVEVSGAMEPVMNLMLGSGEPPATNGLRRQTRRRIARLVGPTAIGSAVLNNTPLVAALAPEVQVWAQRHGLAPSRLLMPVSFAAILGGVVTVIGTSTNLVVSGLLEGAGFPGIGMFEITRVGLPVAVAGLAVLLALGPRLLPAREGPGGAITDTVREFSVAMRVVEGGPLVGQSLEEAGLRNLQGVFCVQVDRKGRAIAPVEPTEVLAGGDVLTFVGDVDHIVDLQRKRGLASTEEHHLEETDGRRVAFFEAVVGPASPLVGRTLKGLDFRDRYGAAVLAIHRSGQRVERKLGQVPLRVGDTLLLLAQRNFREAQRRSDAFVLVAQIGHKAPARTDKAGIVGLVTVLLVAVAGAGLLPVLHAALLAAFALVALKVLTFREAFEAVDMNVIVVIASSFGLASALTATGLAELLATGLVDGFAPLGAVGGLVGVLIATSLLTEVITNNAAAALMFPIAIAAAGALGADPRAFAIGVAIAASASFSTPIGYQTNTMVYGLGGYRFTDYLRLGPFIQVTVLAVAAVVIPLAWPL